MFKNLLGIAPQQEQDGSFRPSKLALKLATSDVTDYRPVVFSPYQGKRSNILVVLTERKKMTMKNGMDFSTGNHPVETLVPMLHLRNAGFNFSTATPTGKPTVFERWAMPTKDSAVMGLYEKLKSRFDAPLPLRDMVDELKYMADSYAAVFIPGGHGAMLGIPQDPNVGELLRWADTQGLFTISICHGPGALLSTTLQGNEFLYAGYDMAVFPDSIDKQTPMLGYLPGNMPWQLGAKLESLGAKIVNRKGDDTCCVDRRLITGASPMASDKLGRLAASTLLEHFSSTE